MLMKSVAAWNDWRSRHPDVQPDLSGADLRGMNLREIDLRGSNLRRIRAGGNYANPGAIFLGARFDDSDLTGADLRAAILRHSSFQRAVLHGANLTHTDLYRVNFGAAHMRQVDLWGASLNECAAAACNLSEARLRGTSLLRTDFSGSDLSRSLVYGCSVWDVNLTNTLQQDLIVTPSGEKQRWRGTSTQHLVPPVITCDNLELAQLIYLLLHNDKIRNVIDTIGQKGVLILGRFIPERKKILDALRVKLREMGFVPLMFDFDRPTQRDFTETVKTLAGLSRFIVADITNPRSSPLELQATVPDYMVPLVPILQQGERPFSMFADLRGKYDWVVDVLEYDTLENLLHAFPSAVVAPAIARSNDLIARRAEALRIRHVRDYIGDA